MRRWRGVAFGAVVVLGLSGCSAMPDIDPDQVQDWIEEQADIEIPGSLATLSGVASPLSDVIGGEGVTTTFEAPTDIISLMFSCFGPETMSVDITLTGADAAGATQSLATRVSDLTCDGSPQQLDLRQTAATAVTANGVSDGAVGAWAVFVVGRA